MYSRATATAWILFVDFGIVLFTVSLSWSESTDGMLNAQSWLGVGGSSR